MVVKEENYETGLVKKQGLVKQGWWWPRMRSEEVFKPGDPPDPGQLSLIKPQPSSFVKGTLA